MGMKPPMNEDQVPVKGAVTQQRKRDAHSPVKGSATTSKATTEKPIKGANQKKGK